MAENCPSETKQVLCRLCKLKILRKNYKTHLFEQHGEKEAACLAPYTPNQLTFSQFTALKKRQNNSNDDGVQQENHSPPKKIHSITHQPDFNSATGGDSFTQTSTVLASSSNIQDSPSSDSGSSDSDSTSDDDAQCKDTENLTPGLENAASSSKSTPAAVKFMSATSL